MARSRSNAYLRGSVVAKYRSPCRICGAWISPGDRIWSYVDSWICAVCRWPARPVEVTWGDVVRKIKFRAAGPGMSASVNLVDIGILADKLSEFSDLVPIRRGGSRVWSEHECIVDHRPPLMMSRIHSAEDAYGIILDALEYRFAPNVPGYFLMELLASIENGGGDLPDV